MFGILESILRLWKCIIQIKFKFSNEENVEKFYALKYSWATGKSDEELMLLKLSQKGFHLWEIKNNRKVTLTVGQQVVVHSFIFP